jgi:glucose/arabinose dehydrogenase
MKPSRARHRALREPLRQTEHPEPRGTRVRTNSWTAWTTLLLSALAGPAGAQYELENAFPNLTFQVPVDIQVHTWQPQRIYVAEKRGVIYGFPEDIQVTAAQRTVFLDLSSKVLDAGEAGLLGFAFHPLYGQNGYFFVYYVTHAPYRNIVARYRVSADPAVADPNSELILIDDSKTNFFHNGGQVAFGPGNLLYISIGDDTRSSTAQDLTDLFGSVLRVAPNVTGTVPAYTIPAANPYAGNPNGYREEVFASGFRNPWRFSIDPATGNLWVGDVGEDTYEEIDIVESGANCGWPLMEGPDCFQPSSCDTTGKSLSLPISYYDHGEGIAVIGGHVYRGSRLPELQGQYLFGDLSGGLWSLDYDGVDPPVRTELVPNVPGLMAFGVGNAPKKDLYLASSDGSIYRISHFATAVGDTPASRDVLLGNFPNPFNPTTTIRYRIENAGHVAVEIVSVDGARVRWLDHGAQEPGVHALLWRGETDAGRRAPSGVYFYRLLVDGTARAAARMVLLQ